MPEPTTIDHNLRAGNSWEGSLTFFEDDGVTLANTSGYSVRMWLKANTFDVDPAVEVEVTPNVPLAKFDFKIYPADTAPLVGVYYYSVEVTYAVGDVKTEIDGTFTIKQDAAS